MSAVASAGPPVGLRVGDILRVKSIVDSTSWTFHPLIRSCRMLFIIKFRFSVVVVEIRFTFVGLVSGIGKLVLEERIRTVTRPLL